MSSARWARKDFFRKRQENFYKREGALRSSQGINREVDANEQQRVVSETKLGGDIQIDSAGRVTMPEQPQNPRRIER